MSVINQMLRDLEKRQGAPAAAHRSPEDDLKPRTRWGRIGVVLLIGTAAALGALGQWWFQPRPVPEAPVTAADGHPRGDGAGWDRVEMAGSPLAQVAGAATPQDDAPVTASSVADGAESPNPPDAGAVDPAPIAPASTAVTDMPASSDASNAEAPSGSEPSGNEPASDDAPLPLVADAMITADDVPPVLRLNVPDRTGARGDDDTRWERADDGANEIAVSRMQVSPSDVSPQELAQRKGKAADAAYAARQFANALSLYRDALALDPQPLAWRRRLAELALASGDRALAQAVLAEGIQYHPKDLGLRMTLATLLQQQKNYAAALAALDGIEPGSADRYAYHQLRGGLAQQIGQWSVARDSYEILINLAPMDARNWLGLAIATDSLGQAGVARSNYNRALSLSGLSPEARAYVQQRLAQLKG